MSYLEVIHFLLKESFQRWQYLPILIYHRFYIFKDFFYRHLNLEFGSILWVPALVLKMLDFVVIAVVAICVIRIFLLIRTRIIGTFWIILGKVFFELWHIFCFAYVFCDVFTKKILWMLKFWFAHTCILITQRCYFYSPYSMDFLHYLTYEW